MHPFYSIHSHGLLPRCRRNAAANADATVALARRADAQGVDLVVFPELNLTSYAIDNLHLQSAQQRATRAALAQVLAASL